MFPNVACDYKQEAPFPGYRPEAKFEHGGKVVVARLPRQADGAPSAVISETRMPACFFTAHLQVPGTVRILELSTGSGTEIGALLHKICSGLASGTLCLVAPEDVRWRTKKKLAAQEDGSPAEVFVTDSGFARVDVVGDPYRLMGATASLTVFCGKDLELAMDIAQAVSEGMLAARYL